MHRAFILLCLYDARTILARTNMYKDRPRYTWVSYDHLPSKHPLPPTTGRFPRRAHLNASAPTFRRSIITAAAYGSQSIHPPKPLQSLTMKS